MKMTMYSVMSGSCCFAVVVALLVLRFRADEARDGQAVHPATAKVESRQNSMELYNSVNKSAERKDSGVLSNSASAAKHDARSFSRAEDRGEDLSQLDKEELLKRLAQSTDVIELRKAAKALGDRSIAGTLDQSEQDKMVVSNIVQRCLEQSARKDAKERVEARQQIERLWWVAAPALIANIKSREPSVAETVIKSLVLMRSEEIVRGLMTAARTAPDPKTRALALFALGKMTEKRESLIPGRTCMSEDQSKDLSQKMIQPFLEEIAKIETNTVVLGAVSRAVKDLESAVDRRMIPEVRKP